MKIWKQQNKDKVLLSDKKFRENHKDDEIGIKRKAKIKEWHDKNKDRGNLSHRKSYYDPSTGRKEKSYIMIKEYRKRYPERIKARNIARCIKILKEQMCEECTKRFAKEKHHEDYSKPLQIKFLCTECHNKTKCKK